MSIDLSNNRRLVWNWSNFLSEDTRPCVVNATSGNVICELVGHTDYIRHGFELRDERLLTWSNDQTIRIWRLSDGFCEHIFKGHEEYIRNVNQIDEKRIISSSGDGTIRIWSLADGTQLHCYMTPDVNSDLDFAHVMGERLVASANETIFLFDLSDGRMVAELKTNFYTCSTHRFDDQYFLYNAGDRVSLIAYADGVERTHIPSKGLFPDINVLSGQVVMICVWDKFKSKKVTFELWAPLQENRLGSYECSGENVCSIKEMDNGEIIVSCNDYRLLVFQKEPFTFLRYASLPAKKIGGFDVFDPLEIDHLTPGDIVPAAGNVQQEKPFGPLLNARSINAREARPTQMPSTKLSDFYSDNRATIANWFARGHNLTASTVEAAIAALEGDDRSGYVKSCATKNSDILVWQPISSKVWLITPDEAGTSLKTICLNNGQSDKELIHDQPLISPDGFIYLWQGNKFCQLEFDGQEIRVSPELRNMFHFVRWCTNDRIVIRDGGGVDVRDIKSGELIKHLDGGHGEPCWGFVELSDGKLVTWSRESLRSWTATDYEPLVELREPVDWGPGSQIVKPLSSGELVFTLGYNSSDSRVMVWDGAYRIMNLSENTDEISDIQILSDGSILSREFNSGDYFHWRVPQDW